jgi:hypothetical protein
MVRRWLGLVMARNREYWARKEHYERTGSWPETPNQAKRREARERAQASASTSEDNVEQAHPAVSQQLANAPKIAEEPQEDHVAKVVRLWWTAHPHLR